MTPSTDPSTGRSSTTRLWIGISIIVVGVLAALDNLPFVHHGFFLRLWPLVLVVIGLTRIGRDQQERGISGYALILGGLFLLLCEFGNRDLIEYAWPFFIVMLGIFIVTKALRHNRGVPADLAAHDSFLSGTAIFGGTKRRLANQDFKGGEMTAIFGGFELDLRQAVLECNQVRVDVFILFGGGELRVPQDWVVTMKATTIAGAFEDKTLHLPGPQDCDGPAPLRPTLVITGLALFGGLTVSN
jgi:hypothetical protein